MKMEKEETDLQLTFDSLGDDDIQEIFLRIPQSSYADVSLVSKRWLFLLRSSTTSLSIKLPEQPPPPQISQFLSQFTYLSSLSLQTPTPTAELLSIIASSCPLYLYRLSIFTPVSPFYLINLSICPRLSYLQISLPRPLNFFWLAFLPSLKHLCVTAAQSVHSPPPYPVFDTSSCPELHLQKLCLHTILRSDDGLNWIWKHCVQIKSLTLCNCSGIGNLGDLANFLNSGNIQEVVTVGCVQIIDHVLRTLRTPQSLNSLIIIGGYGHKALLAFINESKSNIERLKLTCPHNNHIIAISERFKRMISFGLENCCRVKVCVLKVNAHTLQEFALHSSIIPEGFLATIGPHLGKLTKLSLSDNTMVEEDFISMIRHCQNLTELELTNCHMLTDASLLSLAISCQRLKKVDLMMCRMGADAVQAFVVNSSQLKELRVEDFKISRKARNWAYIHSITLFQ